MGCYGIGLGRIIATIIENNVIIKNDKIKGFVIPYNIAPYKVQIICNEANREKAEELYKELSDNGIKAIIDDRENMQFGAMIGDVYTLGTPKMIVLGNKFNGTQYEVEDSKTNEKDLVNCEDIVKYFK